MLLKYNNYHTIRKQNINKNNHGVKQNYYVKYNFILTIVI